MHPQINIVQISLTTHCNMKCPECCCAMQIIPKEEKYFVTWEYLEEAAKYLYGVDTISLTGGEPTIHPKIEEWSPKLKELFGCRLLTMSTNGTMFKRKADMFRYYDKVFVTHYTKDTFEGSPENIDLINYLKDYYSDRPDLLHVSGDMEHVDRSRRGKGSCFRASMGAVHYENGQLFPCCVGPGLEIKKAIPLTENWRTEINQVSPPCHVCFFAED